MLQTILTIVHVVLSVFLIVVVLFQSGKTAGLSGSIAGGAETFFGKTKGSDMNKALSVATGIVAAVFGVLVLVMYLIFWLLSK